MQNKKLLLRPVLFIILCFLIFLGLSKVLNVSNEYSEHAKMMINGYYDLEDNTVDAVFIGSSHVYRYWQSAFAWKEQGLATAAWSTSNMPFGIVKGVTEEVLKTQSPKVLCVEASPFQKNSSDANNKIYLVLKSMKESTTKYSMINEFCRYNKIKGSSMLEYYIPFIQFHSRWYEINEGDFRQIDESYLNSCYQQDFLETTVGGMEHYFSNEMESIYEDNEEALREYLDYCKTLDCEVLFYITPVWDDKKVEPYNYVQKIIEEYGFTVINFNIPENYELIGLDESTDIQDSNHTNIKGSVKFTRVMGNILKEKYGLVDRSQEPGYEEWDKAADKYYEIVSPYINE